MTLSKGPTTTTPVRPYVQPNKQITLMPKPNQNKVLLSRTKPGSSHQKPIVISPLKSNVQFPKGLPVTKSHHVTPLVAVNNLVQNVKPSVTNKSNQVNMQVKPPPMFQLNTSPLKLNKSLPKQLNTLNKHQPSIKTQMNQSPPKSLSQQSVSIATQQFTQFTQLQQVNVRFVFVIYFMPMISFNTP